MLNCKNTHKNQKRTRQGNASQNGFSLVELMVGLVIGLLATLVIVQVFSVFEGRKRSTSGTSDAQTNGSIALMSIQRDVQMAGYGLPLPMADKENSSLKCAAFADFDPDNDTTTNNSTNLFPLVIVDGASNASDTITVRFSTTAVGATPVFILNAANATSNTGMVLANNIGCNNNDIALISSGNNCMMATVADANGNPNTPRNLALSAATPTGGPLVTGAKFACMGNWQNYTYQIVNNELRLNGRPIVSEVVNMQAQYGVSSAADSNQVNEWVNATGTTWTTPTIANRNRIKAIRVAVVVRNGLMEKETVSTACSSITATNPTGVCAWDGSVFGEAPEIDLTGTTNWDRYRYRVFETIIPMRNMLWSREAL
ncbi:PilW family protein [Methylotenera sp. 73s]|nr:PilW family protein [Methylotenera sp. 73s]